MLGRIHSVETFGTVDGPGVRFVVFFQGCPMRCLYCHNPDTWDPAGGSTADSGELIGQIERNRPFYRTGGITATGGEPMLQMEFLTDLFERAKAAGIHTALDTSGICYSPARQGEIDRLLSVTDLVLLDVKQTDPDAHKRLTGREIAPVLTFGDALAAAGTPVWIRRVVVPGYTDGPDELRALGRWMAAHPNIERLEVLPYHLLGKSKYQRLGIPYPLEGVPAFDKEEVPRIEAIIREAWGR